MNAPTPPQTPAGAPFQPRRHFVVDVTLVDGPDEGTLAPLTWRSPHYSAPQAIELPSGSRYVLDAPGPNPGEWRYRWAPNAPGDHDAAHAYRSAIEAQLTPDDFLAALPQFGPEIRVLLHPDRVNGLSEYLPVGDPLDAPPEHKHFWFDLTVTGGSPRALVALRARIADYAMQTERSQVYWARQHAVDFLASLNTLRIPE